MTFSSEQLNHFKFSAVVLDEFPVALRGVFTSMWDTLVASPRGVPKWDDSVTVLNLLHANEGGVKKVPSLNKSFKEWDCTALFRATLFAQTFAMPDRTGGVSTLDKMYVRPRGLSAGVFHPSVISPSGDQAETYALALDQLRLLRNTLCHQSSTQNMDKATFDNYIMLAKDAFTALGQDTTRIAEIGMMGEEDFPTARQRQLEDELKREKDAATKFKQIDDHLTKIESLVVEDVGSDLRDVKEEVTKIKELMAGIVDLKQTEKLKAPLVRDSCIPDEIPHFVGRKTECQAILDHLTDENTRLVDVWGPPGFGKTSVAINVAHHLREMKIPVYFVSLRGMESKDELVSKLLSIFTNAAQAFCVSPSHWLVHCLQQLKNSFVLILDNADDLLESADAKLKEEVLRFIQEIAQCNHIKLLLTTRESLDYLSHKLPIHLEKVGVLDEATSGDLVKSLLSDYSNDDCSSIVKECGQVPLAMRLMCSIMREESVSFTELLEELKVSPLVKVLDSDNFPNDARLKTLINKSFERLTDHERRAFVSLAVFPWPFDIENATALLEYLEFKTELQVKDILRSLERKSLIDCSEDFKYFTIHSLFQSFIKERRDNDRETADILAARRRFYSYHITRFEVANEKYLTGPSFTETVEAFRPEYIVLSLIDGIRDEELYYKVVEVLSKAELFFFSTMGVPGFFQMIYDTALKEAQKRQNLDDERKLLAAKSFSHCCYFSTDYKTWTLPLQVGFTSADNYPAKLVSYFGIYQLLCGNLEEGISSLKSSLNSLGNSCDEVVLKQLVYQVLVVSHWKKQEYKAALYFLYLFRKETETSSLYIVDIFNLKWMTRDQELEDFCLVRFITYVLLKTWINDDDDFTLISQVTLFSRVFSKVIESFSGAPLKQDFDEDFEACAKIYDTISSFYTGLTNGNLKGSIHHHHLYITEHIISLELVFGGHFDLVSLLTSIGFSYFMLNNETEAVKSFQSAFEQRIRLGADDNWDSPNTYLKTVQNQLGFGICKKAIGAHLNPYGICCVTSDFTKAPLRPDSYREGLSFVQQVLNKRLKFFGEHVDTAHSFDTLGVICYTMRDLPSAVEAFQKASDMRSKLLGDHEDTARSYLSLGVVQYNTGDLSGAVESLQKASQIKNNISGDLPGTTGIEKLLKCVYEDFIANELD